MRVRVRQALATLRAERSLRWVEDAHHCVVCGGQYGPNDECRCEARA